MHELIDELANPLVLVVDDESAQTVFMRAALEQSGFLVIEAENGVDGWELVQKEHPDMVISDVVMPRMDGFTLCRTIRQQMAHLPVVLATSLDDLASIDHAYQVGATDFITKPVNWVLLGHRVRYILRAAHTAQALAESKMDLTRTRMEIIRRLGQAAEYRDNETGLHILRMSQYSSILGRALGFSPFDQDLLLHASPMHDVGKIGIPDAILLKPGKLSIDEFAIMKQHTILGGKLLDEDPSLLLRTAHMISLTHHERWDGQGYPYGLAGENIPVMGRICSLTDVFDALTSKRPYKQPWSVEDAVDEIQRCSGSAFDPSMVRVFVGIIPEILKVKDALSDMVQV
ncbi:MAG: response regulator [Magnetococcales bacterium]|nr:response regulator [Magnetococcales bacterium]MBF0321755.1 response regulator [Magnetococcales bacterium]